MAEWIDLGDGIYSCSNCGIPCSWVHPILHRQTLGNYCYDCGARMENANLGGSTPREMIEAHWIKRSKTAHQYFCSVCGGKESGPREWCPRCGTHMSDGAWKRRWAVREEWKNELDNGQIKAEDTRAEDILQ